MRVVSLLLAVIALVCSLYVIMGQQKLDARLAALEGDRHSVSSKVEEKEGDGEFEVAEVMGRLQRFHEKWWTAGKAGNAALAKFYLHEMEESMEEIIHADVVEDGVALAPLMKSFGIENIERLEKKLEEEGVTAMVAGGSALVQACNACHTSTGYGFIRIQMPTSAVFPDQDFAPAN